MLLVNEVRHPSPGHSREWTAKEKSHAYAAVRRAIKAGTLIPKEDCERCGRHRSERRRLDADHYLGYDEEHWLDVLWLCQPCHGAEHNHPDELAERMRQIQSRITPDQRRAVKRVYTDEGRRRIGQAVAAAWARLTPEERSQRALRREANLTDEVRQARRERARQRAPETGRLTRERAAKMTPEERAVKARHATAGLTPEQRSANAKKAGEASRIARQRRKEGGSG